MNEIKEATQFYEMCIYAPKVYKMFREHYLNETQEDVARIIGCTVATVSGSETTNTSSRNNSKVLLYYIQRGLTVDAFNSIINFIKMSEKEGRING